MIFFFPVAYGFAPQEAHLLNVLLNKGVMPRRALPGYIATRFGAFNTMIFTSLSCGALVLALWLTVCGEHARVMAFSVLFGFWSVATISISLSPV
jgi:hypothetical protein